MPLAIVVHDNNSSKVTIVNYGFKICKTSICCMLFLIIGGVKGDKMIDYEFQDYDFKFPAGSTFNRELTFNIIDDDIVEPRNEYYLLKINSSLLPDRVSAGEVDTLQINIVDDDGKPSLCYVLLGVKILHTWSASLSYVSFATSLKMCLLGLYIDCGCK